MERGSEKMDRKQVISEVDKILESYCKDCLLKAHFRKEHGKTYAHRFCIEQCTVGQQIKKIGQYLK